MTNREFYLSVINGEITEDTIAKAGDLLAKLDAQNEKRRNAERKPTPEADGSYQRHPD